MSSSQNWSLLQWQEHEATQVALWRADSTMTAPRRIVIADDSLAADSVRLDPALPKLVTHFHLSSSQRRDLLERFDHFLDQQPELLPTLQRRYGITE